MSQTVFIGSIPFDATEQQVHEIFVTAGPIKALRLVSDKETGKPKGYAFCEYFDTAAAESAVRNLNGAELSGRQLRVGWAEENPRDRDRERDRDRGRDRDDYRDRDRRDGPYRGSDRDRRDRDGPRGLGLASAPPGSKPVGAAAAGIAAAHMTAMVGGPANPGPTQSRVNGLLGGMTPLQLYETVGQMRSQIRQDPERARQTLINNPQLTKALFQAQILLGMVKPPPGVQLPQPQAAAAAPAAAQAAAAAQAPAVVAVQPGAAQQILSLAGGQQGGYGAPVQVIAIDGGAQGMQYSIVQPNALPAQPVIVPAPAPAPQPVVPAPAPAPQAAAPAPLGMDQHAVLQQVLRLTQAEIDALPEAVRAQVMQVKQLMTVPGGM